MDYEKEYLQIEKDTEAYYLNRLKMFARNYRINEDLAIYHYQARIEALRYSKIYKHLEVAKMAKDDATYSITTKFLKTSKTVEYREIPANPKDHLLYGLSRYVPNFMSDWLLSKIQFAKVPYITYTRFLMPPFPLETKEGWFEWAGMQTACWGDFECNTDA